MVCRNPGVFRPLLYRRWPVHPSRRLLLSGQMAFAYFLSHFPRGFWPVLNGGERAALFCFIFLLLVATGPGRLALDNVFFGKGEKDAE